MKQARIDSIMEVVTGTFIGLIISVVANYVWFTSVHGIEMSAAFNVSTSIFFTVISIARSYGIRRAFNGRTPWQAIRTRFTRKVS